MIRDRSLYQNADIYCLEEGMKFTLQISPIGLVMSLDYQRMDISP